VNDAVDTSGVDPIEECVAACALTDSACGEFVEVEAELSLPSGSAKEFPRV